jgi:F0F1-type ATP synthase assembly protein I
VDSAHERDELRRIERWLAVNDPRLAAALSAPGAGPRRVNRRPVRLSVDLLGAVCVLIGVVTGALTFVFVGVVVLMVGACLHTTCV